MSGKKKLPWSGTKIMPIMAANPTGKTPELAIRPIDQIRQWDNVVHCVPDPAAHSLYSI